MGVPLLTRIYVFTSQSVVSLENSETRVKMSRISRPRGTDPDRFSKLKKGRICGRGAALAFPSLLGAALLVCTPANSEARQRDTLLEAKTLTDQASLLENAGDYSRAETLCREALTIRESLLDPADPEVAESLDALAMIYYDEARFGEAEELLRRAIKIDEKVLGSRNSKTAAKVHHRATRRAEPLLRQALSILQKTFGVAHPNVAETLRDLGILSEMEKDYSSAEQQYRQALEIREKSLGSEHRYVAESLNDLG